VAMIRNAVAEMKRLSGAGIRESLDFEIFVVSSIKEDMKVIV
jgi:hypothetical protein